MKKLLEDKVIVVTGGNKGVGKGVVLEAAREGAKVVIGARDEEAADMVLDEVKKMGAEGCFIHTDLRKFEDCSRLFEKTVELYGKIDGFYSYAGVTYAGSLEECDEENYYSIFETNVRGSIFCCQSAIKYMKDRGGSIILNGSPHAWSGEQDRVVYACSKGALLTLTEHIARHYAQFGIRANYITMGWTPTEGEMELRRSQGMSWDELHKLAASIIPAGRMTEVEDIVPGVIYLLSDNAKMVSGANLRVTGGWYI